MKSIIKVIAILLSLIILSSCAKGEKKVENKNETTSIELKDNTVLVIRAGDLDAYDKTLAVAFQGIVNRSGPKIFVLGEQSSWINTFDRWEDGDQAYPEGMKTEYAVTGCEGVMLDDFAKMYNLELKEVTLNDAIDIYKDKIAGLIEYDMAVKTDEGELIQNPARTNAVITAAGVYTSLPVTDQQLKKFPVLSKFETVINMKGKFRSKLQATKWAVDTLLDNCSTKFVSSYFYEGENGTLQNDYAVMNSAFCYELAAIVPENMDHVFSDPNTKDLYNPSEANLLNTILEHVEDYGFVWGWGQGGENGQASAPALYGLELVCANMGNGSFYAQLPCERKDWKQPNTTNPDDVKVENKFYLAFMTNEGDSYKAFASLQNYGAWKQSARGEVPISWGADPLVMDLFPALADYYYSNATENDTFFAAAAGYGYLHPYYLPLDMQDGYAEKIKTGGEKYGFSSVDIWWFSLKDKNGKDIQWEWFKKTGMRGLTLWNAEDRTTLDYGYPVIKSSLYYVGEKISVGNRKYKAGVVADALTKARKAMGKKTFCTVVYGGSPDFFKNIADALDPSEFEIVSVDELHIIAEKAGASLANTTAKYDISGSVGAWDPTNQE